MIGIPHLTQIPKWIGETFKDTWAQMEEIFLQEHDEDGHHTNVTATSVTAEMLTVTGTSTVDIVEFDGTTTTNQLDGVRVGPDTFEEVDDYPALSSSADTTKSALQVERDLIPYVDDQNYLGWQGTGAFVRRWRSLYFSRVVYGPRIVATTLLANAGAEIQSSVLTPAQITADQNNYAPTGFGSARVLRLATDASRTLTGYSNATNGNRVTFTNIGAQDLVLAHESGSSTAGNRFLCPGAGNVTLNTMDSVGLWYDTLSSRWRVRGF